MRPRNIDIFEGTKHGHLTVIREVERDKQGISRYECKCDCGRLTVLRTGHFTPSRRFCSRQCTFLSSLRIPDLTGKRFSKWTVLGRAGLNGRRSTWKCRCDCGTERTLAGVSLSAGQTLSCGCLLKDIRCLDMTPEERLEHKRAQARATNRKNPARIKANKIKYEKKLSKATPAWLTKKDWDEMNAVYETARRLTQETGIKHQVDHIHPINGKTVSGLHVPRNLQILTQAQNVSKSNRYAELSGD